MKPYTYRKDHEPFYEHCYDLLVKFAGARPDPMERMSFVMAFTQVEYPCSEYRFQGTLGFGGKFYRSGGRHHIGQYPEDATPKTRETIEKVNQALAALEIREWP